MSLTLENLEAVRRSIARSFVQEAARLKEYDAQAKGLYDTARVSLHNAFKRELKVAEKSVKFCLNEKKRADRWEMRKQRIINRARLKAERIAFAKSLKPPREKTNAVPPSGVRPLASGGTTVSVLTTNHDLVSKATPKLKPNQKLSEVKNEKS
jgi:DNA repair exonuclease SbcCD nuclease subunit